MASFKTLILCVYFCGQALLEFRFHIGGARVAVVPGSKLALSGYINGKAVGYN